MIRHTLFAVAATAILAACANGSSDTDTAAATPTAGQAAASVPNPADYVAAAGASDLFEIQSGQLAQQKGQSASVKSFGSMMVSDHTKTTQQVVAAAKKSGMNPAPPKMNADQQRMMTGLQGASGASFDTMYARDQVMAHEQALALHQGFAQSGSDANLKAVAQTAVPIVQGHLTQARRLPGG